MADDELEIDIDDLERRRDGPGGRRGANYINLVRILAVALVASLGTGVPVHADGATLPKYSRTYSQKVPFGHPIGIPYILDAADLDGDGHDDWAVGAKIQPPRGTDVLKAPKIRSFAVQNQPQTGKFRLYDLGEAGLTHRTFAGALVPTGKSGGFLVLGRNGEIGLPDELVGEPTSIFRIAPQQGGWGIGVASVSKHLNTTGSVAVCDIDRNGVQEVYINNVGSARSNGLPPYNVARMYQVSGGGVRASAPLSFMGGMMGGNVAIHNFVGFADIDKDGDCDLLGAYEGIVPIRKTGPLVGANGDPFAPSELSRFQSYVVLNTGRGFGGGIRLLPNPPFGRNTSSFGIGGTRTSTGEVVVALTSSYLPSHQEGFSRFVLQMFALRGGQFVEVTGQLLSGKVANREANQSFVEFADIDGDGDDDFYLTRYDGGITVFMQTGGRFVGKKLGVGGSGQRAVRFLKAGSKACMDLAVLDQSGRLTRYSCN